MEGFISLINQVCDVLCGWPLLIYVSGISIIYTIALRGLQFTYLFTALKETIFPSKTEIQQEGGVSPFHAFMTTINSNLGNGVVAGVATAIYSGGPGAAFWLVLFGLIIMIVRFAEVYLSGMFASKSNEGIALGGPMLYLRYVVGGTYLPHIYAFFCTIYGLLGGNIIQSNSIAVSLSATWNIAPMVTGTMLLLFVLYILFGGADRIVKLSLSIVPIKVIVFSASSLIVLVYHAHNLLPAISLMISSSLGMKAFAGGMLGFSIQQVIAAGLSRSIFATESGLGSAAIMFGSSGSSNAVQNGFMGMVSTFISTFIGFIVALCIVASGVWSSGLNSTALTIASFETVFGVYGGWIVSFLAVSFGLGVMVSYAYVVRSTWLFLTNNRFIGLFNIIYSACALAGAVAAVDFVWDLAGVVIAIMLYINLYGLLFLLPKVKQELPAQLRNYKA
jgi:alanine or glycine:cation symporter, AGCS family